MPSLLEAGLFSTLYALTFRSKSLNLLWLTIETRALLGQNGAICP